MNFHALASTGKNQILNKTSDAQLGFVLFSLSGLAYLGFQAGLSLLSCRARSKTASVLKL